MGDSVMQAGRETDFSRRDLLSLIGTVAGSTAMYHAMSSLGFAGDSGYAGPIKLRGDVKDTSVLILGAGLAGMTAAGSNDVLEFLATLPAENASPSRLSSRPACLALILKKYENCDRQSHSVI